MSVFERFTDRARRVLTLAQEEARLLQHDFIGTEHILLGLISEGGGVGAKALEQLDVTLEEARQRVEEMIGLSRSAPVGNPPFTPRAKKVLELSLREAMQLGHKYIRTEHMLLGLVREGEGVGAQVLVAMCGDLAVVRQAVLRGLSGRSKPVPTPKGLTSKRTARARRSVSATGGAFTSKLVTCSFCGLQPPETGQLVSGTDAFICEHCIEHWARSLGSARVRSRLGYEFSLPGEYVGAIGEQPEHPEVDKAEIRRAFAAVGTPSDDGESVPAVEGGEDLGPTLLAAQERHAGLISQGAEIRTIVDKIVYLDTEHAIVWFTIAAGGRYLLTGHRGDVVRIEDNWKVARSTFCALMKLAGVECPPPSDGPEV